MNHSMKLNPAPYAAIKTGKKNIELRLNDEKRQQVKVGDGSDYLRQSEIPTRIWIYVLSD